MQLSIKGVLVLTAVFTFSLSLTAAEDEGQGKSHPFAYTMPAVDPSPENPVELVDATRGSHPRLLFTQDDIAGLQEHIKGAGKADFDKLVSYLAVSRPPEEGGIWLHNSTTAQQQGLWRMPTVGLHYVLTGDKRSFERSKGYLELLLSLERWDDSREPDSGMGHGNVLAGASLLYDWLYNDLPEEFRDAFRQKLLLQARRQYYGGHLRGNTIAVHYWQGDPQNNHRWHRNAGFVMAAIALAEEDTVDEDWIVAKAYDEIKFIVDWMPDDGTTHESPSYMVFGAAHLYLAVQASDINFGTEYLQRPFFTSILDYRVYTMTPGFTRVFGYGDSGERAFGSYANYHFKAVSLSGNSDYYDAILKYREKHAGSFWIGWMDVLWHDSTVERGAVENLALAHFFPDIGFASIRDGWAAKDVAMTFKSSPLGGHLLNEYRNERNYQGVNVAHDDPDANSFMIYTGGEIVAKTDGYSYDKVSSSQNTILVNGKGQRGEGGMWSQPIRGYDMTQMANVVAYKELEGGVVIVEGEAGGAYPDLTRYRRTMVWVPGKYILMLDDIRADEDQEITSLVQSSEVKILDSAASLYELVAGDASMGFAVACNEQLEAKVVDSTAQARRKLLGYKQLQLTASSKRLAVATVFDAWGKSGLGVELDYGDGGSTVVVKGSGFVDTWNWEQAVDEVTPATLSGKRIEVIEGISGGDMLGKP